MTAEHQTAVDITPARVDSGEDVVVEGCTKSQMQPK